MLRCPGAVQPPYVHASTSMSPVCSLSFCCGVCTTGSRYEPEERALTASACGNCCGVGVGSPAIFLFLAYGATLPPQLFPAACSARAVGVRSKRPPVPRCFCRGYGLCSNPMHRLPTRPARLVRWCVLGRHDGTSTAALAPPAPHVCARTAAALCDLHLWPCMHCACAIAYWWQRMHGAAQLVHAHTPRVASKRVIKSKPSSACCEHSR